ncbi:MAG: hypothetical protein JSW40_07700 [Candidatus Omnitrophota bacterium]|nr:MAG: hypothetical protein JSW40_07700 [Candidatus Omnitrophota bacterium]
MKKLSMGFLLLGVVAALGGFIVRIFDVHIPIAPLGWIAVTNTLLLFSIAINVLIIIYRQGRC